MIFAVGRHLFESTIFALLVGILTLALHKRGAATRHALWFIAVVKFAVPVATLSAVGLKLQNVLPHSVLPPSAPLGLASFLAYQGAATQLPSAQSTPFHPFVVVWLAGALARLAVWLPKLFAPLRSPDSSSHLDERILSPLKERIGLRSDVHIRLSESNVETALIGFWRPVVTIPDTLPAKLSESELEAVILHELAHAKRLDNWTGAFAHALACIFWFYPLLWWIERRLYREREHACDEIVVRSGVTPEEYLAGILKVCRFHLNSGVAGVSAVSSSNLRKRMEVIMSLSASRRFPRIPKIVLGSLIIVMTIVPVVIGLASPAMANGQSDNANKQTNKQVNTGGSITCVFASVEYPEGTVIREDGGPEQMCARVLNPVNANKVGGPQYSAQWIHTSKEIRERSRNVVRLPQPPPFVCTPKVETQEKSCACEESSPFSQNSVVDSANGGLRCDKGKWMPLRQLRLKYFGFGQARAGAGRRAFISDGDAVYIVAEDDIVLGRYRIIKINHTNLEFEEISSGRHCTAKREDEEPSV